MTATIGSIEQYAVHDGPGIRTTVFFKGCALACPWCHNPELMSFFPEIAFYPGRCIGCGDCAEICPEGAASLGQVDRIDRVRCTNCGKCTRVCPGGAVEMVGRSFGVSELVGVLLRNRIFYDTSNGGVTLSGGEPTSWMDFIHPLVRSLKSEGIHIAIQTNGYFRWSEFENVLPFIDLVLFDLKLADPEEHLSVTGVSNGPILANLQHLMITRREDVVVRIPLIPGYTATEQNILALADICQAMGVLRCSLLMYHPYGIPKAEKIGKEVNGTLPRISMSRAEREKWSRFFTWAELVEY